MKAKMKVINMEFSHDLINSFSKDKQQAYCSETNKDISICQNMLSILKQQSATKIQKIKEFLNGQVLHTLTKITDFFIKKNSKSFKQVEFQRSTLQLNEKIIKQTYDKTNKKMSQMLLYIQHIKQKLCTKQIQAKSKEEIIGGLKKQIESLRVKIRRQKVLKELNQNSCQYLSKMQIASQAYHRPQQLEINVQSPTKSNIFYRTSYQSQRLQGQQNDSREKRFYGSHTCSQLKSKTRQSRRQIRKTFDKIYGKEKPLQIINLQKEDSLKTGLLINQKSISKFQKQNKRKIVQHNQIKF